MNRSDFWSRRKAAVAQEAHFEVAAAETDRATQAEAALAERSDEDLLTELELPEPESLDSAEAVQGFLKAELPQRLKRRAMRRLWRLNPVLANLDGLVDYGEDYTDAATVIDNLQTVYQVGKGMFDKLAEAEQDAEPETALATDPDLRESDDLPDTPEPDGSHHTPAEPDPIILAADEPQPETAGAPRRMRFEFET